MNGRRAAAWRATGAFILGAGVWLFQTWQGATLGTVEAMLIAACLFGGGAGLVEALTKRIDR